MTRRPAVALALGYALGAALPGPPVGPLVALPALLFAASPVFAPIGFGWAGWVAAAAARAPTPPQLDPEPRVLEGRVDSVPERLEERVRFVLRVEGGARLLTTAPNTAWPLALGDRIRLEVRTRAPERPRNPGGRDRRAELAGRGIALEAHASSPPIRVAAPSPLAWLEAGRSAFALAAARALPPRSAALVRAIGTGDRGAIDAETSDAFARSGLAHLLSVSGLHLAVVAVGLYRVLRFALCRVDWLALRVEPRHAAAAAALPLTAAYAVATGADVPVVRSAIAAALGFGAIVFDREPDALNGTAVAALAVLAFDPGSLRDPSFQLSFASVAGLAFGSAPLRRALPIPVDRGSRVARLREALLVAACASAAATVATAPIVAFHFRRLSLAAAASNVVGVPIGAALTVTAAVAAVATSFAPPLASPLLLACRPIAWLLLTVNDLFAAPSWAAVGVGSPGVVGVGACYACLLAAWRLRGRWRAVAAIAAAAALLAPAHARRLLRVRRGGLEVVFLSVGQGDATALLLPDGSAVVVDGGGEQRGRYDPGARDVVPWLRDAGVRRLSAIFLSHPHPDHLFGLPSIAAAFPPAPLYTSGRAGDEAAAAALARLPSPRVLAPGDVVDLAGIRFEALGPPPGSEAWTENDASLVLRVTYGATSLLLPGDVEREGEAALLAGVAPERLRSDVAKLPHHGSKTSSSAPFVAAVNPAHAVATVGRDNRFGFPAATVVQRWAAHGATVHRTDEGAVRFLSDGRIVRWTAASSSIDALALARERP